MNTAQTKRVPGEGPFNARPGNRGWNIVTRRRRRRRRVVAAATSGKNVPLMHVMKYMVPSVLVFATLGKPTNPASMWCFVAATCLYWLTVGEIKQPLPTRGGIRFRIYGGAAVASGILSAAFLVSMLLPRPASIWIPPSAGVMLYAAFTLLYRGIKFVVNKMLLDAVEAPSTLPV